VRNKEKGEQVGLDLEFVTGNLFLTFYSFSQRKNIYPGINNIVTFYRIYSEEEYKMLEKYSTPELQRVPLDSSLLQMIAMGLPDVRKFPFIEPPPATSIENAILSLKDHVGEVFFVFLAKYQYKAKLSSQGALTDNEKITCIGKTLARLPVDITIGKMLIMGSIFHQVEPVLSLAAALSIQTPFTNRAYRDTECEVICAIR